MAALFASQNPLVGLRRKFIQLALMLSQYGAMLARKLTFGYTTVHQPA